MSAMGYSREAIRVKVKKYEASDGVLEHRKFSVDPQITSIEVLRSILAKAFDMQSDFAIYHRQPDADESYATLLSDWDLDAAFLKAHNASLMTNCEPCLSLRVSDEKVARHAPIAQIKTSPRLHGLFNQMGKTFNIVKGAFNFGDDSQQSLHPPRAPLSDTEFRQYMDPVGQILHGKQLRADIYLGGIEPSLRKVVWKFILNVYPDGMTGRERMDYIKRKASEYTALRDVWREAIAQGPVVGELAYTTGMVRKDVLRTDRHHPFYAGSDDNQNIAALFNILTTYALNHPKVSYCQGMSDLASPLLVTMGDEAHAYICFCALMTRLSINFMIDGIAMTQKFTHLAEALHFYDPEYYNYLKAQQADDLLFCYRWLLLEMKREFAFDDSLRMLEVLWSSLPSNPPQHELKLFDVKFLAPAISQTPPISPLVKTPRENAYTKVCALRRQHSSISLGSYTAKKAHHVKRQNHSLDDTSLCVMKESQRPRSVSPLQTKSDSSVVMLNNRINGNLLSRSAIGQQQHLSSSTSNLLKHSRRQGHLRDLKEKLGIFASLEALERSASEIINEDAENKPPTKMIKNLNEFLSFAASKNKISDTLTRLGSVGEKDRPKIMLTKSSVDDSESSSIDRVSRRSSRSRLYSSTSCEDPFDETSPDDSQDYDAITTSVTRDLRVELENLDRQVFATKPDEVDGEKGNVFIWENPLHEPGPKFEQVDLEDDQRTPATPAKHVMMNSCEEVSESHKQNSGGGILPAPHVFGGGNPFLMFLCLTVLLQHRDHIMSVNMDYNEMAMHFDKMVRKHNVTKVLNQARQMFQRYMKRNAHGHP